MIKFDDVTKEKVKERNPNWLQILDHPYKTLIVGGSGSGKTNALLNAINHEPDIEKNLYAKDPYEAKYQFLVNNCEDVGTMLLMILKLLLNTQNINLKLKTLIVFDEINADMLSNKTLITELVTEVVTEVERLTFLMYLSRIHISKYQKMLE